MQAYTYLWLREDGSPYYVGKGTGRRGFKSGGHNVPRPKSRARIIVQEWLSHEQAYEAEKFLIEYYGRIDLGTGCLRNLDGGGRGRSTWSEEQRRNKSEQVKRHGNNHQTGRKRTSETKLKIKMARAKQDPASLSNPKSPEARAKMSAKAKLRKRGAHGAFE